MRRAAGGRWQVVRVGLLGLMVALVAAGCMGPVLANPAASRGPGHPTPTPRSAPSDPQPIALPADDAPHDRLTEWWYYTGHLRDTTGRRYGFEYVIFRAERGTFPVSWAAHLAITDEAGNAFHYAQRSEVGPQVAVATTGLPDTEPVLLLQLDRPTIATQTPAASTPPAEGAAWLMQAFGDGGFGRLAARATPDEATAAGSPEGLGLDLLVHATKSPVLHDGDGWIDFGPAGGSYYYSRTSMSVFGMLTVDGHDVTVWGSAWFDHQWGDFISVGGGGWDWFALNLDDGTDLTLSRVRSPDGSYPLVYGTLVDRAGSARKLDRTEFTVGRSGTWRSPRTGTEYPAGWTIVIPGEQLRIELSPTVADQELDTRETTGVVYWEGSQIVRATRAGVPVGGEAYVELTGYGP